MSQDNLVYEYDFVILTSAIDKVLNDINSRAAQGWRLCDIVISPSGTSQIFVMERLITTKENDSNDQSADTSNGPGDEGNSTKPDDLRHTGRSKPS